MNASSTTGLLLGPFFFFVYLVLKREDAQTHTSTRMTQNELLPRVSHLPSDQRLVGKGVEKQQCGKDYRLKDSSMSCIDECLTHDQQDLSVSMQPSSLTLLRAGVQQQPLLVLHLKSTSRLLFGSRPQH